MTKSEGLNGIKKAVYPERIRKRRSRISPHTLEEHKENVGSKTSIGAVWVPQGFERELVGALSLSLERLAQSNVDHFDCGPDNESCHTRESNERLEDDSRAGSL